MDFLIQHEPQIRMAAFFGIFAVMALWEIFLPRRTKSVVDGKPVKTSRWLSHGALTVLNSITLRLIFPAAAVGAALYAEEKGLGLFHVLDVPLLIAFVVSFLILDFAVWLEHWASHKLPILWRIHKMHHADVDLDVTSALRFHPLEIILSMFWKAAIVVALGAPAFAVLLFEVVLNGMAMFNHSNVKMPLWLDRIVRVIFVTPDMHRIHHSIHNQETDSNYGFNFAFWDRLFKTYTIEPRDGQTNMVIGLDEHQDRKPVNLLWSLILPFHKAGTPHPSKPTTKRN